MTSTVFSVWMIIQVVTNWGPIQRGEEMGYIFSTNTYLLSLPSTGQDYRQVANVESQEVLRIELSDGQVISNVLKSTTLSTITKRGRQCQDIIWNYTNESPRSMVMYWNYTNAICTNSLYMISTIDTYTAWTVTNLHAAYLNTESNTVDVDALAAWFKRSQMSWWDKVKEWWR